MLAPGENATETTNSEVGSPSAQSALPRRSRIKSVLIAFLMTPFYLLLLEGILYLSPYQPRSSPLLVAFVNPEWKDRRIFTLDPVLFWRFRPNQEVLGNNPTYTTYRIPINNLGFRGDPFPDPKAEDRYRILFLGDSCVFGWDVPVGSAFPDRLLEMLEHRYPNRDFHAFLGAVPGYSSFQARLVLDTYGSEYAPQMVIVYLGSNDALPCMDCPDEELMARAKRTWRRLRLLEKSRLFCVARDLIKPARLHPATGGQKKRANWEKGPFRVSLEEFDANLRAIIEESRENLGARIVFLTRQDLSPNARVFRYNDVMRKVAAEQNVPLVDVQEYFAACPQPFSLYAKPATDKIHPNAEGYDAIARMVLQTVVSKDLIDSPPLDEEENPAPLPSPADKCF